MWWYEAWQLLRTAWLLHRAGCVFLLAANAVLLTLAGVFHSLQAECDQQERWYGTQYSLAPTPPAWLAAWRGEGSIGEGADDEAVAALHLPAPNPFIPSEFDMIEVRR